MFENIYHIADGGRRSPPRNPHILVVLIYYCMSLFCWCGS